MGKKKQPKYWVSKEYVSEIKKYLWHVWETGITHSKCIDAYDDKTLADTYCNYLNKNHDLK